MNMSMSKATAMTQGTAMRNGCTPKHRLATEPEKKITRPWVIYHINKNRCLDDSIVDLGDLNSGIDDHRPLEEVDADDLVGQRWWRKEYLDCILQTNGIPGESDCEKEREDE
jgi:hypothetical protein